MSSLEYVIVVITVSDRCTVRPVIFDYLDCVFIIYYAPHSL